MNWGIDSILEILRLNVGSYGPVVAIIVTVIFAVANIIVARGGRIWLPNVEAIREAIAKLNDCLDSMTNSKRRLQIVDFMTGRLLIRQPRTAEEAATIIQFLNMRHPQNLKVFHDIRPYLTRWSRWRLAWLAGAVDRRRRRIGKLLNHAEIAASQGHAQKVEKISDAIGNGIIDHLNSVIKFERQLVAAIRSGRDYYVKRSLK